MAYSVINLKDLAELKQRRGTPANTTLATILGLNYPLIEAYSVYVWDDTSTQTPDDNQIVQPTINGITTGRWYKIDLDQVPQINSDWNASNGVATILNKPIIPSGTSQLVNNSGFITGVTFNSSQLIGILGYTPYDSVNPNAFISGYTETDPTVPAYAKSLTGVTVITNYTNNLYKSSGYTPTWTEITSKPIIPTGTTQLINNSGFITGITSTDINNSLGYTPYNSTNPKGFITGFTESDPTVPTYAKSLTGFTIIKTSTDQLYKSSGYTPSWNEITNKPNIPTGTSQLVNDNGFITGITSSQIATSLGYTPYNSSNPNGYINGYTESDPTVPAYAKSLTGVTVIKVVTDTLYKPSNYIPIWAEITGKPIIPTGTTQLVNNSGFITGVTTAQITSGLGYTPYNGITNPNAFISGYTETDPLFNTKFSGKTTSDLIEGNNLYYTDNRSRNSISGSSGITYNNSTGLITNNAPDQVISFTSGKGIQVTGTYPNFTIATITPTINIITGKTLNSNFTLNTTKEVLVSYTLTCTVTNPLLVGTSTASAYLEYSLNSGTTWVLPSQISNSSGVGLTVTVQMTNGQTSSLVGMIPANALVRIRTVISGTGSVTFVSGQEIYY